MVIWFALYVIFGLMTVALVQMAGLLFEQRRLSMGEFAASFFVWWLFLVLLVIRLQTFKDEE